MLSKIFISEENDIRLDLYLLGILDLNRSQIKKLIDNKNILVNNKCVKSGYKLSINDEIQVNFEDEFVLEPKEIDFDTLYEDDHIAVISKPQGLVVHPGAGNFEDTLVSGLMYKFKNLANTGDELRPGIIHRLDKDTSGLMIIVKSDIAYENLISEFKNRNVEKTYLAIVEGKIESPGLINKPIGRNVNNRLKMDVTEKNSKEAITKYTPIEVYNNHTFLEVNILTGRTHQIRVHMKHIGHPVLGDLVYGNKNKFKIDKQMLHSYKIKFTHPITGELLEFVDAVPDRFNKFLKRADIWKL